MVLDRVSGSKFLPINTDRNQQDTPTGMTRPPGLLGIKAGGIGKASPDRYSLWMIPVLGAQGASPVKARLMGIRLSSQSDLFIVTFTII